MSEVQGQGKPDAPPPAPKLPKPSESQEIKESVSAKRQTTEISLLASNIIQSRGRQLEAIKPQERNVAFAADQGDAAIFAAYELNEVSDKQDFTSDSRPKGMSTWHENNPNDKPIIVRINGKETILYYISSFDGANFYGWVEGETPGSQVLSKTPIPRAEVLRGQLLNTGESLLNSKSLSESEKVLLGVYLDFARDGEKGIVNLGTDDIDRIIIAAAKEAGSITTDDLRSFVGIVVPEDKRVDVLKTLEGRNLADADTLVAVLGSAGLNENSLVDMAQKATEEAAKAEAVLATGSVSSEATAKLKETITNAKFLQRAAKAMREGGFKKYFEKMEKGEIPKEKAQKIAKAFREGGISEIINLLMSDLPDDEKKRLSALIKAGKFSLLGVILVLLIGHEAAGFLQGNSQR